MPAIRQRRSGWQTVVWFVNGVLGANRYENYLAHHRVHGCGEPLTERQFWKAEYARQERNPSTRCC